MQIANVKQRQIWFPRVGNQIWACTPQNLTSGGVCLGKNSSNLGYIRVTPLEWEGNTPSFLCGTICA